jgi:hypothetical protein
MLLTALLVADKTASAGVALPMPSRDVRELLLRERERRDGRTDVPKQEEIDSTCAYQGGKF